jgi:hypothetical protein
MPKLRILLTALLLGICLPIMAQEVYRSTDAQGNIVFSDQHTPGAETVVIDAPNIADPVNVPPPSTTPAPAPKPTPQPAAAPLPEGELVPVPETHKKKRKRRRYRSYEYGP